MSELNRTIEEYIEHFAHDHGDNDTGVAAGQAMMQEIIPTLKEE